MKAKQPKIKKIQKALSQSTQLPLNFDHEILAKLSIQNT